jgi:thioredoxin reductase/Pyruvate/2-oxoacid:ferredoxin oxidoreductase delta subunit
MSIEAKMLFYFVPFVLLIVWNLSNKKRVYAKNTAALEENKSSGLTEPASLHPIIDPIKCLGCASCVSACPEGEILGVIDGRAQLIHATHCIGHGACKDACPRDAITLVFGTENRGVDIPEVKPNFETNMPGIFIAGELGGMGLIRNAIEQGRRALENISRMNGVGKTTGDCLDLVIVGAGPAGFAASLGAIENKLKYVTVEQETLGGTVSHFPRGKLVMTAPVELPMVGKVKFTETTKEELLGFWQKVEKKTKPAIRYQERVEQVSAEGGCYRVKTNKNSYLTRSVLLAIGRRGTPRKLGVPGEERSKVVYRLIDAEQYRGKHVLVVGGGDSALEAATSIAEQPGTEVSLSYRSEAFSRAKQKNRNKVEQAEAEGRLTVLFKSNVKVIGEHSVKLDHDGELVEIPNDGVIVSAGGLLPTPFLKETGIEVETKYGTA